MTTKSAKLKTHYYCSECGGVAKKWTGRCEQCGQWNTLVEKIAPAGKRSNTLSSGQARPLSGVEVREESRLTTGIGEFDRVLGGGMMPGGVVLLGGDPGIGKSTILLQALSQMAPDLPALYVSGEESLEQVALRASRLQLPHLDMHMLAETNLERVMAALAEARPKVVVIDSIQTMFSEEFPSMPGSVTQVRECAVRLTHHAKQNGVCVFFVGHVTKDGSLAGPRVLEHIVDTVLYFEGDTNSSYRLIRAFKNRFGAVNELGVFAMTDRGLKAVNNPSALFLSHHDQAIAGSSILVTQEGTRPMLVEVQALVDPMQSAQARRLTVGLEQNRLAMLLAVLHRHAGVVFANQDVFVNAVGGMRISEPASDLAVVLAIVSSLWDKPVSEKTVVFGEIGLAGEIRPAPRGQERLREAVKLGFTRALVPKANLTRQPIPGLEIVALERVAQALDYIG